jgi:hypothetical protein
MPATNFKAFLKGKKLLLAGFALSVPMFVSYRKHKRRKGRILKQKNKTIIMKPPISFPVIETRAVIEQSRKQSACCLHILTPFCSCLCHSEIRSGLGNSDLLSAVHVVAVVVGLTHPLAVVLLRHGVVLTVQETSASLHLLRHVHSGTHGTNSGVSRSSGNTDVAVTVLTTTQATASRRSGAALASHVHSAIEDGSTRCLRAVRGLLEAISIDEPNSVASVAGRAQAVVGLPSGHGRTKRGHARKANLVDMGNAVLGARASGGRWHATSVTSVANDASGGHVDTHLLESRVVHGWSAPHVGALEARHASANLGCGTASSLAGVDENRVTTNVAVAVSSSESAICMNQNGQVTNLGLDAAEWISRRCSVRIDVSAAGGTDHGDRVRGADRGDGIESVDSVGFLLDVGSSLDLGRLLALDGGSSSIVGAALGKLGCIAEWALGKSSSVLSVSPLTVATATVPWLVAVVTPLVVEVGSQWLACQHLAVGHDALEELEVRLGQQVLFVGSLDIDSDNLTTDAFRVANVLSE